MTTNATYTSDYGYHPVSHCGCGTQIVYTPDGWQHTDAPWFWGNDHQAHTTDPTALLAADRFDEIVDARSAGDDDDVKSYDHDARPDDDADPGDRCKNCGEDITWMGPAAEESVTDPGRKVDWLHVNDLRNN